MQADLTYSDAELMASHPGLRPLNAAGHRLHGGFDASGEYCSPRTLHRWPAVRRWQEALQARGWPLIDASRSLLAVGNFPSVEQQAWLLSQGCGQTLWNSLTVTGVVEARGRMLAQFPAPDFQALLEEDITGTTLAHLGRGLFRAHGFDEGGEPDSGQGGHDVMWFAARDLLFGADAWPMPEVPPSLARPQGARLLPMIDAPFEAAIVMMMNVLMIEVRAEAFFSFCLQVMRDPRNFADRREAAEEAARMVAFIREDEQIHVAYLQTALSELRSFTFRALDGARIPGQRLLDPLWEGFVRFHAVDALEHNRAQTRAALETTLKALPEGERRWQEFEAI
jgi:hypothetical protein